MDSTSKKILELNKKLEEITRVGYQIHIKNTTTMRWFCHFQKRTFTSEGIKTKECYLEYGLEDQFHDTIEEAMKQGIRLIEEGNYVEI